MIDITKYTIEELAKMALEKPQDFGYWGKEDMFKTWGFTGIDSSRDSDILERSNFKVISEELIAKFPNDFRIENFSHWAVGYVDRLVCRILNVAGDFSNNNITEAFKVVMIWHEKLMDYPVADENAYDEILYEECIDFIYYMSNDLTKMINRNLRFDWADLIYSELIQMNVFFNPDCGEYPTEDEIFKAVYLANLCNLEFVNEWNEWADKNNLPQIDSSKLEGK